MTIHIKQNPRMKPNQILDYKDIDLLTQYITEQGKILPKRTTGLTTKQQKRLTKNIKRARILSLLPFLNK
uniref:ribosomal protein S18 n=1 Tax=Phymatolithon calcareum TaxID=1277942 RepID=UPI0023F0302C|nr:ribosomal protein S18 [Phymatolithon calcareum]WEA76886.1 ribosomal protein S18 [Phymatolithon calcareum]